MSPRMSTVGQEKPEEEEEDEAQPARVYPKLCATHCLNS